jgi:hypothetical protein
MFSSNGRIGFEALGCGALIERFCVALIITSLERALINLLSISLPVWPANGPPLEHRENSGKSYHRAPLDLMSVLETAS